MPRRKFSGTDTDHHTLDRILNNTVNGNKVAGATRQCEIFPYEFIKDFHVTKAAKRSGYSEKTAFVQGSNALKYKSVRRKIAELIYERMARTKIDQDAVVNELACIAFSNPANFFNEDGTLKNILEMQRSDVVAIKEIQVRQLYEKGVQGVPKNGPPKKVGTVTKLKFYDKISALELLGRHLGMFDQRFSVDVNMKQKVEVNITWEKMLNTATDDELNILKSVFQRAAETGNQNAQQKRLIEA